MKGRVLVIDDSPDDRFMAAREVARELPEVHVDQIHDAAGLVRALEATDLLATVTDFQLRWTDGITVLRQLKVRFPEAPVVMFTSSGGEEIAVEAMKAGLDDYVLKSARNYRRLAISLRHAIERAADRRAHREAVQRIQRLFEGVPVGLFLARPDGVILEANPALAEITGRPDPAILQGAAVADLLAAPALATAFAEARDVTRLETALELPDGRARWVEVSARRAAAEGGAEARYEGFVHDVSDRRRADEAQRERAAELTAEARRKDEFVATLSHELRNPLGAITTAAALLRRGDGAARERATDAIDRQVTRLSRMVDDLLDISRVTRGKIELQMADVDLVTLVRHAVDASMRLVQDRGHSLSLRLPATPVWAQADAVRIEQVVTNLIENAAKYTDRGGRIDVALEATGNEATLRVRDTGVGIPADLLPHIFDLFVQGERTLDRRLGGLGVGLTLVRHLTEMHGGAVQAQSAGPGQGSQFLVRLPLGAPPDPSRTGPPGRRRASGGIPAVRPLRVFLVEDNDDFAESLEALLRTWGHAARRARDGTEALAAVRQEAFDLALIDVGLPGIDGLELARRLRASGVRQPLVALTGYGQEADLARTHHAGFDAHLTKPVTSEALEATLRRLGGGG